MCLLFLFFLCIDTLSFIIRSAVAVSAVLTNYILLPIHLQDIDNFVIEFITCPKPWPNVTVIASKRFYMQYTFTTIILKLHWNILLTYVLLLYLTVFLYVSSIFVMALISWAKTNKLETWNWEEGLPPQEKCFEIAINPCRIYKCNICPQCHVRAARWP